MVYKNWLIKIFGVLDIILFLWILYQSYIAKKIPFYTDLQESLVSVKEFGLAENFFSLVIIMGSIALVAVIFSGILMFRLKKYGVYISLIQAPFRLFLVIPPTFFFLAPLFMNSGFSYWIPLVILTLLELTKVVVQIMWLKCWERSALYTPTIAAH